MDSRTILSDAKATLRRLYFQNSFARLILSPPVALRQRLAFKRGLRDSELARRIGEKISGDVVLEMPEFMGQFRCSPKSDLFKATVVNGSYERKFVDLFRQYLDPERDFIDVGANIGFYSVLAAKLLRGGRVLSFEPTDAAYERLTHNIELNGVTENIIVFKGVASDKPGETMVHQIDGMEEYSSMGAIVHDAVADKPTRSTQTMAETVDALVARHSLRPGLIKIDVEGAEALVLRGSIQTLTKHRPVVLSELSRALLEPMGSSPEEIVALFKSLNYRVLCASNPRTAPALGPYDEILCLPN